MSVRQGLGDSSQQPPRIGNGQSWFADKPLGETFAVHECHHEIDDAVALIHRVDRHDAWVRKLGRCLRFAEKAFANVGVEGEFRRQHLDRDATIQPQVGGAIDDRHPAATDLRVDEILCSDRDEHAVE